MGQENSQPVAECDARTVADPRLYLRGGGGRGGHPDPGIRGDPVLVWSKNRGGVDPPGPSSGSATEECLRYNDRELFRNSQYSLCIQFYQGC